MRAVRRSGACLQVETDAGIWRARIVISATGTWWRPYVPYYPGIGDFGGRQLHTADYGGPGSSPARTWWSSVAATRPRRSSPKSPPSPGSTWVTRRVPRLLPDEVDGRALFDLATRRHRAALDGESATGIGDLGDIVAVRAVREARDRGLLKAEPMFTRIVRQGRRVERRHRAACDVIVWCTGFRPALGHLAPLRLRGPRRRHPHDGTRALGEPRLHLLGYGDWTGPASATLIGAGRTARDTVAEITRQLQPSGTASGR